jgi:hypothetical protein
LASALAIDVFKGNLIGENVLYSLPHFKHLFLVFEPARESTAKSRDSILHTLQKCLMGVGWLQWLQFVPKDGILQL